MDRNLVDITALRRSRGKLIQQPPLYDKDTALVAPVTGCGCYVEEENDDLSLLKRMKYSYHQRVLHRAQFQKGTFHKSEEVVSEIRERHASMSKGCLRRQNSSIKRHDGSGPPDVDVNSV